MVGIVGSGEYRFRHTMKYYRCLNHLIMDERLKARYIDPMVDWSFKRLFGSEVNKDILIEFLKVIFPEHEIEDITSKSSAR